ncbi:hypothetical protein B0T24DRAFT_248703 [Lasiosphaeria ovina]|uniref:Uncharacterized protein n=1 Tax=Lasiosphaeria ovina TaxID=92902 RepID=A0AAE0KAC8_9PEZI|nr:hypothetical protein B0T24DRAFT_248703 [Lasiosphaeria ovina]
MRRPMTSIPNTVWTDGRWVSPRGFTLWFCISYRREIYRPTALISQATLCRHDDEKNGDFFDLEILRPLTDCLHDAGYRVLLYYIYDLPNQCMCSTEHLDPMLYPYGTRHPDGMAIIPDYMLDQLAGAMHSFMHDPGTLKLTGHLLVPALGVWIGVGQGAELGFTFGHRWPFVMHCLIVCKDVTCFRLLGPNSSRRHIMEEKIYESGQKQVVAYNEAVLQELQDYFGPSWSWESWNTTLVADKLRECGTKIQAAVEEFENQLSIWSGTTPASMTHVVLFVDE